MWIKICANTSFDDAQLAIDLGADALGFVFAPSARQVTAVQVAAITAHLAGEVERIGVFQTSDPQEILDIAARAGLTGVQLHGGHALSLARALRAAAPSLKIVQTVHWSLDSQVAEQTAVAVLSRLREIAEEPAVAAVLMDSKVGSAGGGTGRSFDWAAAQAVRQALPAKTGFIVAGGLRPDNVAVAIEALRPTGVDVASGVEASPGRKDPEKLKRFLANARSG